MKLKKLLTEAMLDNVMLKDIAKNGDARRQTGGRGSPGPALGEVGLPVVGRRGLVLELLGRLDDDVGWTGNQVMGLE